MKILFAVSVFIVFFILGLFISNKLLVENTRLKTDIVIRDNLIKSSSNKIKEKEKQINYYETDLDMCQTDLDMLLFMNK